MTDEEVITTIINQYFEGLHNGDVSLLNPLFREDCVLKTPDHTRTKLAWLEDVSSRDVPAKKNFPWNYEIIWIDRCGPQAMVKARCPLPHGDFIDYLGLLKQKGKWRVVNKMYANFPVDERPKEG